MEKEFQQPSQNMIVELKRLRGIVLSCDQQFGDFIRYCMAECKVPEDYIIDVNTWAFIHRPQPPKVTSIGEAKKKEG